MTCFAAMRRLTSQRLRALRMGRIESANLFTAQLLRLVWQPVPAKPAYLDV